MTAAALMAKAGAMHRESRAYCSNAYYTVPQLDAFLAEKDVQVLEGEDAIFLLEKDRGLYRLQFYARSPEALAQLPSLLPPLDGPLVTDLVGREPGVGVQAQQVARFGFAPYSVFKRMVCRKYLLPHADGMDRVEFAAASDAEAVLSMIAGTFDPLFAHLPTLEEIGAAIERREITVIRQDSTLAGLAFFEKESDTYYVLRYFVVDPAFRGQNIGGALMRCKFTNAPENSVYMLWVGTYNSAQELYLKFGFQYDGLTDHILKYEGNS